MQSLLATKSIKVTIMALDASTTLDMQFIEALSSNDAGSVPTAPGLEWGSVDSPSGNNWKDLNF
jgi:hypothetical protein